MLLPEYAGSLLRGQFGDALRRTVCLTGLNQCRECQLYRSCQYPAIFETPAPAEHALQKFSAVPNPYVIEPPPLDTHRIAAGDDLVFNMVLVGRALAQLPLVVFVLRRALQQGISQARAKAELIDVAVEAADGAFDSVWDAANEKLIEHATTMPSPPDASVEKATLRISTPLRLQHQGRALRASELSPRTLLTAIMRRTSLLLEIHAGQTGLFSNPALLAQQALALEDTRNLRWRDWTRYSSRQKQEMTLGGVLGEWTLAGNLKGLSYWLWLGQWLHVGKNATMGMGRYQVAFH